MRSFWSNPPYVPTPETVVTRMLQMAKVKPGDVVYDLGSGDGRILIKAVKEFGAELGVGYEIDPRRCELTLKKAEEAGVKDRIKVFNKSFFDADLGQATVITLYLTLGTNEALKEKLAREAKAGTRVVSHYFCMPGWHSSEERSVEGHRIYLYVLPRAYNRRFRSLIRL